MKRTTRQGGLAVLILALVGLQISAVGGACAGSGRPNLEIRGTANCPLVPAAGGPVFLELWVRADAPGRPDRRPVNLSVVLDRSGSMGSEQKIENARAAVRALIDQLRRGDYFSLVIYDDEVDVLIRSARVTDKELLRRLVDEITPRGWTNLGGGLVEGIRQAERHAGEEFVNRVILLSDGLANRGITDPGSLGELTVRASRRGISLTTIGMGWDFNEHLMVSLAEQGGGNYYFIESPRDLASVFRREFDLLGDVVATSAVIELELDIDVRIRDIIGYSFQREGSRCRIPIGDLVAGEERSIIVELELPAGKGARRLAAGTVSTPHAPGVSTFSASVTYAEDLARIEAERNLTVQARADVAVSTRQVEEALAALEDGDEAEAHARLEAAEVALEQSAAAAAPGAAGVLLKEQQEKLKEYKRSVNEEGGRAKKAIHYDNYRTQKKK